jgi:sec-independent protein translocase protein TatA
MNETILLFGMPNGMEMLLILAVLLLLFGGSKLPQLAKALGQSKRAFKEGMEEADAEAETNKRREQLNGAPPAPLAAVDDETLFEEARRRAQAMRAREAKQIEEGK